MRRLLLAAVALIAAVAALAPAAALAAPAPKVTSLKIYRTPSGSDKGALTVIAMLDFTGFAKADDVAAGQARPLTRATVTLTGAHHRVVARDSVMVHPLAFRGAPERFDFRIPAARAKALDDAKVRVRLVVRLKGRSATFATARAGTRRAVRQFGPAGFCIVFCPVSQTPPPAPGVAFGTVAYDPTACLGFGASGYAQPFLYEITAWDAAQNAIIGGGDSAFNVAPSGAFSDAGAEQPAGNPGGDVAVTLSGTVPADVLTAAPSAGTGPMVLYDSGAPFGQFANPLELPYQPNLAAYC